VDHSSNNRGSVTDGQLEFLARLGVQFEFPLSKFRASELITRALRARRQGSPSPRQERFLRARGAWRDDLTWAEASDLIGRLVAEGA
jgi:hypothetical protein